MKKFNFVNKIEPVEICGKEFTFDVSNIDWIKKVLTRGEELQFELASIANGDITAEKLDKLVDLLEEAIELFLGKGEFKRIYESEECNKNTRYLIQLCTFLMEEVKTQAGN